MSRYVKIILGVCAGLLALLAIAVLVLALFDWNHARPWINRQASELAHRPVAIQGDLSVQWQSASTLQGWRRWLPWPRVTAHQLVVGNPPGSELDGNMAEVDQLSFMLNPWPLLDHTVDLVLLEVGKAEVVLSRDEQGVGNWRYAGDPQASSTAWQLHIRQAQLSRARVRVVDAAGKGTSTLELEGSVTQPQQAAALDVRLRLAGDSMAELYELTGVALPSTPPYHTEGRLLGMLDADPPVWRYEDFKGVVGKSDLNGTLQYEMREPRPLLTGEVQSRQLRLQDLGPLIGADTSDTQDEDASGHAKPPPGRVLPVDPIHTGAWAAMDADVRFQGSKIVRGKNLPLDDIEAHVTLRDRVLSLQPLNFGVAGGTLGNTIVLDGRQDILRADLRTTARHLKLKQLFPGAQSMDASFGEVHGDARLKGQGNSIAALLGHADGELQALVSRGTVSHFLLEAAGLNVANMLLVKLFGDEQVMLNCVAADVNVRDGLVRIRTFKLETDDTTVAITGGINLRKETLDLDVRPENKSLRVFTLRSPLYAKGTLKDPDVGVQAGPVAARAGAAVALGVVATPLAALLPLLNFGTDEATGCGAQP